MSRKETTTKEDLIAVVNMLENSEVQYWIDGGWGKDILVGKQTRTHNDIDINVNAQHTEKLLETLIKHGYTIDTNYVHVRIELYSSKYGCLDVCPLVFNANGTSRRNKLEGGWYEFEKDYFGKAVFEGKTIPCITLKGQKIYHPDCESKVKDK